MYKSKQNILPQSSAETVILTLLNYNCQFLFVKEKLDPNTLHFIDNSVAIEFLADLSGQLSGVFIIVLVP